MALFTLPSFTAGEVVGPFSMRLLDGLDQPFNMEGFTYRVEVHWDGCAQITLYEGSGITRLEDDPSDDEFHYSWSLTKDQGKCVPLGLSPVKLFYIDPEGTPKADIVNLRRSL